MPFRPVTPEKLSTAVIRQIEQLILRGILRPGERLPPGAPPGGSWTTEPFIGPTTLVAFIVLLFLFWPACAAPFCCPCDQRARRPNPPPISG